MRWFPSGGSRDDSGMTLVEMSIATAITGVIALCTAAVYTGVAKNVNAVRTAVDTTGQARLGLDSMTRTLRVATPPATSVPAMVSATATSMSFYASLNRTGSSASTTPNPSLVSYTWDGSCVKETRTPGVGTSWPLTFPSTGAVTRCVLRTKTAPDYSYYTSAVADAAKISGAITTTSALAGVVAVQVTLTASQTATGKAATVLDRITLVNVLVGS